MSKCNQFGDFTNENEFYGFGEAQSDSEKAVSNVAEQIASKQAVTLQKVLDAMGVKVSPVVVKNVFGAIGAFYVMKMLKGNLVKVGGVAAALYIYNTQIKKKQSRKEITPKAASEPVKIEKSPQTQQEQMMTILPVLAEGPNAALKVSEVLEPSQNAELVSNQNVIEVVN